MQDIGGVLMFLLLITENESINTIVSKMAHVVWVKDARKALSLAIDEKYDDILIAEPFNRNKKLLQELDSKEIKYVILNESNDLKQYILDKKAKKAKNKEQLPESKTEKTYSQENVLLVTANQKTIQELCGFNITIATTPYSAIQRIQDKVYRVIVWDLPVEPIKTTCLLYVWERDLKTPDELEFVLQNGHLRI
ncbi:MAG TPA: hypothetical protein P5158_09225, partial [Chitinophagaceae bacterium]|nr:hypothetical protein [Chitinophagaceae bacterium]